MELTYWDKVLVSEILKEELKKHPHWGEAKNLLDKFEEAIKVEEILENERRTQCKHYNQ